MAPLESITGSTPFPKNSRTMFSTTPSLQYLKSTTSIFSVANDNNLKKFQGIKHKSWSKSSVLSSQIPSTTQPPYPSIAVGPDTKSDTVESGSASGSFGVLIAVSLGGVVLICLIIITLAFIYKHGRPSGGNNINYRTARSSSAFSFDNINFTGGRRFSEYMDLSETELAREKLKMSLKRKISAFTKEDEEIRNVSGGRLSIVELPQSSLVTDSDVILTSEV